MFSLVGYGSHGRDIEIISERCGIKPCIFDDNPDKAPLPPRDLYGHVVFGSNYPKQRRQMAERFPQAVPAKPLIDPSAIVGSDCVIGGGSVIAPFALLLTGVTLGQHVHANYHTSMTRCAIGAFTTISPSATICGDVIIGEACSIGASATVCDRSTLGDNVLVAAGAIILPCSIVPDNERVIGVYKGARSN